MAIYIPKPEPIEVYQWKKNGDMPGDGVINNINSGAIVGRHPTYGHFTGGQECPHCSKPIGQHGVLKKPFVTKPTKTDAEGNPCPILGAVHELENVICPGDWVRVYRTVRNTVVGYSIVKAKELHERYVDLATIPKPEPQKEKKQ